MSELADYRNYLVIDRLDLDRCLVEQPEVYYHVSRAFTHAVAARDAAKLRLEEHQARADQTIRAAAMKTDERLTEAAIQNKLKLLPEIQASRQEFMDLCREADEWQALKEAFQQRSFMLRELVALFIAQRQDLSMEHGAGQARAGLSEQNRVSNNVLRQSRSPLRAEKAYRKIPTE